MKNTKLTTAVLALIAAVVFTPSAKAAPADANGILVLGMYDTSGTVTNSYEVTLTGFSSLAYGNSWNLGADVNSVFANTPTQSDLAWSVFTSSSPGATSSQNLSAREVLVTSTGPITLDSTQTAASRILGLAGTYNAAPKLTDGGASISNSTATSFEAELNATPGNFSLGAEAPTGLTDVYGPNSMATFYAITNAGTGIPQAIGEFTFNSATGVLTYGAVPEPSTYALMGVGLLAFVWMLKRRASMML